MKVAAITDLKPIYEYQLRFAAPYFFPADYASWQKSFLQDIDGEGRMLFKTLHSKAVYDGEVPVGFIQYGRTAFGFDETGEISAKVSYSVIRSLYFDEGREDVGHLLLQQALQDFADEKTVYAFFHYFGMSCFARHGKLFERFDWIAQLLREYGFDLEHKNVYYSSSVQQTVASSIKLLVHELTKGAQQSFEFVLDGEQIGVCELHYPDVPGIAYLRWIYVSDELQNQGAGSQCMAALKNWLHERGYTRLDADTAMDNHRAQHYYDKNGFTWEGITRSYYRIK